jgi:hypothetical protein
MGRVSTVAVQRFCKPKVGGSNPSPGTKGWCPFRDCLPFERVHHRKRAERRFSARLHGGRRAQVSAAAHHRRGIRPQRSGRIRPTKVERRRCGARWSAILPKRVSIGDQWKKVLSICVMPRRVIVEPSGSVITVLPPLTLAVATTLAMVPASWPAKLIASPCAWLNPTTVS